MSFTESALALFLATIIVGVALERYYRKATVLREVTALHSVRNALVNALVRQCASLYGRGYDSLDALREATDWQEPLDSYTVSSDWRVQVGQEPLSRFARIQVSYPDIKTARAISDALSAYTGTYITTDTGSVVLSWLSHLDGAALEYSDGLRHERYSGYTQLGDEPYADC